MTEKLCYHEGEMKDEREWKEVRGCKECAVDQIERKVTSLKHVHCLKARFDHHSLMTKDKLQYLQSCDLLHSPVSFCDHPSSNYSFKSHYNLLEEHGGIKRTVHFYSIECVV